LEAKNKMTLADTFRQTYVIKVRCENCGKPCDVKIRKGTSVTEAVSGESIKCDNCKCIIKVMEYSTQWLK